MRNLLSVDQSNLLFDLSCHVGTLFALLLFFRKQILSLIRFDHKRLFSICIALTPLVPAYFLLKSFRDWAGEAGKLGYCLLLTSGILFLGERLRLRFRKKNPLRDALLIGGMQAFALIPGISRSASTITAARLLGWKAEEAAHFSFLLSLPAIFGGVCLEGFKAYKEISRVEIMPCLAGGVVAFVVGFSVIGFAMNWLEKGNLRPFAYYCLGLGVISLYL